MTTEKIQVSYDGELCKKGYDQAVSLIKQCISSGGFYASTRDVANYQRVWARDGGIIGIAALMTGDEELIQSTRRTLQTLREHQGPHGEIPSNIDLNSGRISYGGMAGRVDADLWFIITCAEYWRKTDDADFIDEMFPAIEKTVFLLGAWEFNNRGFLYVPETGDWADEYLQSGYVLYDQLLYLQALRSVLEIRKFIHKGEDHELRERVVRLRDMIRDNYWIRDGEEMPEYVYHDVLYKKTRHARKHCVDRHWMPFFTPHGYGYRFDAMANVLASLLEAGSERRNRKVDEHIEGILGKSDLKLLPAFHPVINPRDEDWDDLKMTFSYHFKNRPHEYHNGGLWPLITGFYVASLAQRELYDRAVHYLEGIHRANSSGSDEEEWVFPEYLHGEKQTAEGTLKQGWSAAAAVMAHHALFDGKLPFSIR